MSENDTVVPVPLQTVPDKYCNPLYMFMYNALCIT